MSALKLRYAGVSYLDRTRAIERGEVQPEGVELEFVEFTRVGDLFRRMVQDAEFEVAEMSLSTLSMLVGRGDDRLVGIPVFPSRAFRHSQIYVHRSSGIREPADLAGRRIGVPEYQMTAAVWIRAHLEHEYGVPPSAIRWQTGGLEDPRVPGAADPRPSRTASRSSGSRPTRRSSRCSRRASSTA